MNYYDILEINSSASDKEIKKAYKKLVKKYHPDVYKGNLDFAEQKIKKINEAYDVLSNSELRKKYDDELLEKKINYNYNYYNNYSPTYKHSGTNNSYSYKKPKTSYEDFYKYDFYKRYYGNRRTTEKSNTSKDEDKSSFNSVVTKSSPFVLGSLFIVLIFMFAFLIDSFIFSMKMIFSPFKIRSYDTINNTTNTTVNNNSVDTDKTLTFTTNTTYSDITDEFGVPSTEYYYEDCLYVFYEKYYFIFDKNNKLINWSYI